MTKPDWAERLQRTRKREYDKGVEAERARIIKLLEANLDDDDETDALHYQNVGIEIAIALIKGEQE